ncbi:MAG: biotin/lipoyl-containing protein, partial [Armatimonadota bacterium]|nr:biotin/lipoyl-containing protein [Armatimonadota bacterium]
MPTEVKMPQLGESTYEGTIGKWLKAPGQRVERFEPLVEIITDKVNVEMPAPFGGTLTQILVPEGTTVATGTPIALMETSEAATGGETPPLSAASLPPAAGRRDTAVAADGERVRLSPVVRRLAAEHGLSLQEVAALPGSGAGGRVTKEDVLRYLGRRATPPGPPPPPAPAGPAL